MELVEDAAQQRRAKEPQPATQKRPASSVSQATKLSKAPKRTQPGAQRGARNNTIASDLRQRHPYLPQQRAIKRAGGSRGATGPADGEAAVKIDDLRLIAATHMMAGIQVPLATTLDTLARGQACGISLGCRGQQAGVRGPRAGKALVR